MRLTLITLIMLSLLACTTIISPQGVYRPSLLTTRHTYVKEFPINRATKQEVIDFVGVPDRTYKNDDIEQLVYVIQSSASEKIEYTYYIKDNIVIDVKVLNQTVLFGNEVYQRSLIK